MAPEQQPTAQCHHRKELISFHFIISIILSLARHLSSLGLNWWQRSFCLAYVPPPTFFPARPSLILSIMINDWGIYLLLFCLASFPHLSLVISLSFFALSHISEMLFSSVHLINPHKFPWALVRTMTVEPGLSYQTTKHIFEGQLRQVTRTKTPLCSKNQSFLPSKVVCRVVVIIFFCWFIHIFLPFHPLFFVILLSYISIFLLCCLRISNCVMWLGD